MAKRITRRQALGLSLAVAALLRRPAFAASGGLDDASVESLLAQQSVPGAALAILDGGAVVETFSYGLIHAGSPRRVDGNTRFQAASLSKTVNALLVLTLVRDGLIGLDDPVNTRLAAWQLPGTAADKVTVRRLLSHTGGINVHGFPGYDRSEELPTLGEILDGLGNTEAVRVTGKIGRFAYSGGAVEILHQMIMDVTGRPYAVVAQERVLKPLGMTGANFHQPPTKQDEPDDSYAHASDGRWFGGGFHVYPELAAAGLWTRAADMGLALGAIYASLRGSGGALLPRPLAREMVRPLDQGAALGTFIDGRGRYNHSGSNLGFRSLYAVSQKTGRGMVALTNGENGEMVTSELFKRSAAIYGV